MSTLSLEQALALCLVAHTNQKRKGTLVPYATHPIAVAYILTKYTNEEKILIVALLHDVIEDSSYSIDYVRTHFSDDVADMVAMVSETKLSDTGEKLPWIERKRTHLVHLRQKGSTAVLMIKVADHIHNLDSTSRLDKQQATDNFNSTIKERLWYSREILNIAHDKGVPDGLLMRLQKSIENFERKLT